MTLCKGIKNKNHSKHKNLKFLDERVRTKYNIGEMKEIHQAVLLNEVLEWLRPQLGESYLDLTAGYGGHSQRILDVTQNYNEAILNDRDLNAVEYLRAKYREEKPQIVQDSFYNTAWRLVECETKFDMILADFGVSSPQLDQAERGFAFARDGRLDMRMDRRQKLDAWWIVNKWSKRELVTIFEQYGEERRARAEQIALAIVKQRPIDTTTELAELVLKITPKYQKVHPATKVFQAIRIAVNDELGEIERTLPLLPRLLKPEGRVALISFHSLEDRLVKNYFKLASSEGVESSLEILTKRAVVAGKSEVVNNPRARSAKLRVAKRV